jgi:hypothetical protein
MATSFNQRMFDICQEWADETGADAIDVDAASDWALANNKYQRLPVSAKQQCMRDMRRSFQQSTYKDPQGNEVRTMHAVRNYQGEQMELPITIWIDSRTAKPDLMQEALRQTWEGIANDVRRHAIEKQSYDLNNLYGAQLSLFDYDFTAQAEDARMTGEYDDSYNEDFDDELD